MLPQRLVNTNSHLQGIFLLTITSVLWSTGGFCIKLIDWNPMAISGIRSLFAAFVIGAAFRNSAITWSKPMVSGAVAYACTVLAFVAATKLTTAANAILLQYTAPVYVAILGALILREKPTRYDWLTMGIVGCGLLVFFQQQVSSGNIWGNILALGSGLSMAVVHVTSRWQKDSSPFGSVLLGNVLTFFCGLPFMFGHPPSAGDWLILAAMGCFQLGLSYVFYTLAIKNVTALETSLITIIEPLLNPLWVFLLLNEQPGFWSVIGGIIILAPITLRYILPAATSRSQ